jgi:hypothetical protein
MFLLCCIRNSETHYAWRLKGTLNLLYLCSHRRNSCILFYSHKYDIQLPQSAVPTQRNICAAIYYIYDKNKHSVHTSLLLNSLLWVWYKRWSQYAMYYLDRDSVPFLASREQFTQSSRCADTSDVWCAYVKRKRHHLWTEWQRAHFRGGKRCVGRHNNACCCNMRRIIDDWGITRRPRVGKIRYY